MITSKLTEVQGNGDGSIILYWSKSGDALVSVRRPRIIASTGITHLIQSSHSTDKFLWDTGQKYRTSQENI